MNNKIFILFLILIVLIKCNYESENDRKLKAIYAEEKALKEAWFERMKKMDFPNVPQDSAAIKLILEAYNGNKSIYIYGPKDPYNRRSNVIQNLKTRPCPQEGAGIIVTAYQDGNLKGSADYNRERAVWLVVDNKIYPLTTSACWGKLLDTPPKYILKKAGFEDCESTWAILKKLDIEDTSYRRDFENPFPH